MSPELTLCHNAIKNIKIAKLGLASLKLKLTCMDEGDLKLIEGINEQLDGAINHIDAYYGHFRSIFPYKPESESGKS